MERGTQALNCHLKIHDQNLATLVNQPQQDYLGTLVSQPQQDYLATLVNQPQQD